MMTRIAKSHLSRRVMYDSGVVFKPIEARRSDVIEGDDWSEPEYAERICLLRYDTYQETTEERTGRSWGRFENKEGYGDDYGGYDS